MSRTLLLLLILAVAAPVRAETYRVDLIVFRNLWAIDSEEAPKSAKPVDLRGAIDPADTAGLSRAGIAILPDEQFGLAGEWDHLKYSKQFRPLVRLAWTQADPPADRGPGLLIRTGNKLTLAAPGGMGAREASEVEGKVSLLLGRFLHLDASLEFIETAGDVPVLWPLDETRRLRRDELHHLDSPRLGILARVTKPAVP